MRKQIDLKAAVDALAHPRIVHVTQPDEVTGEPRVRSVVHPPLITLLEDGTGTSRGSNGGSAGSGGMPGPIDAGALETWGQIRDQVRAWLKQLRAPWSDDLKTDLRTWYERHELAAARGRVSADALETIERTVDGWVGRIERKFDPDRILEWTDPCPAVIGTRTTGEAHRCGQRRMLVDGKLQFAITLNVTRLEAECRACGQRWEGERELMSLRHQTNLVQLERDLAAAAEQAPERDLAMTGPIDLT